MSKFHQRIFIAIDEWLGVVLCCWCWHAHPEAFWPVFVFWAVCVYAISYPFYWWKKKVRRMRAVRRPMVHRIRHRSQPFTEN